MDAPGSLQSPPAPIERDAVYKIPDLKALMNGVMQNDKHKRALQRKHSRSTTRKDGNSHYTYECAFDEGRGCTAVVRFVKQKGADKYSFLDWKGHAKGCDEYHEARPPELKAPVPKRFKTAVVVESLMASFCGDLRAIPTEVVMAHAAEAGITISESTASRARKRCKDEVDRIIDGSLGGNDAHGKKRRGAETQGTTSRRQLRPTGGPSHLGRRLWPREAVRVGPQPVRVIRVFASVRCSKYMVFAALRIDAFEVLDSCEPRVQSSGYEVASSAVKEKDGARAALFRKAAPPSRVTSPAFAPLPFTDPTTFAFSCPPARAPALPATGAHSVNSGMWAGGHGHLLREGMGHTFAHTHDGWPLTTPALPPVGALAWAVQQQHNTAPVSQPLLLGNCGVFHAAGPVGLAAPAFPAPAPVPQPPSLGHDGVFHGALARAAQLQHNTAPVPPPPSLGHGGVFPGGGMGNTFAHTHDDWPWWTPAPPPTSMWGHDHGRMRACACVSTGGGMDYTSADTHHYPPLTTPAPLPMDTGPSPAPLLRIDSQTWGMLPGGGGDLHDEDIEFTFEDEGGDVPHSACEALGTDE